MNGYLRGISRTNRFWTAIRAFVDFLDPCSRTVRWMLFGLRYAAIIRSPSETPDVSARFGMPGLGRRASRHRRGMYPQGLAAVVVVVNLAEGQRDGECAFAVVGRRDAERAAAAAGRSVRSGWTTRGGAALPPHRPVALLSACLPRRGPQLDPERSRITFPAGAVADAHVQPVGDAPALAGRIVLAVLASRLQLEGIPLQIAEDDV